MENLRTFLVKLTDFFYNKKLTDFFTLFSKTCVLFYNEKLTDFFYTEEGEEKHPPVGKDINRPQFPNHSPPCRYDDAQVLGLHVILAW